MKRTEDDIIEFVIANKEASDDFMRSALGSKLAVLIYNTKMETIDKLQELQTPPWR